MKSKILLFSVVLVSALAFARSALAVCPLCTIAVGAGLGLSRWLGIDDSITGLWIGGLIVSLILWTIDWFNKKNIRFQFRDLLVILGYYLITILPLYFARIVAHPYNFLCACPKDKLLIGIVEGSTAFFFGVALYDYLKEKNHNRAHFPYEKVVLPILPLIIFSIIFYLIVK